MELGDKKLNESKDGLSELLGRTHEQYTPGQTRYIKIPAKEVRNNFSEITHAIDFKNERVIVIHRGKAKVALIPILDLEKLDEIEKIVSAEELTNDEKLVHLTKIFEDDDGGSEIGGNDVPVRGPARVRKRGART